MTKKVIQAVKKAVTKKPVVKEVKKPIACADCGGKGLVDSYTLCTPCSGSGQV